MTKAMHARPDLSTPRARAAYRRELRAIARKRRLLSLVALALGAGLVLWPRVGGPWMFGALPTQTIGIGLIAIGLALFAWVFAKRMGHHRRRMGAPGAPILD